MHGQVSERYRNTGRRGGHHRVSRHQRMVSSGLFVTMLSSFLLATAGAASAQTTDFLAHVKGQTPPPKGCVDEAFLCGNATIASFGNAEYRLFVTSFNQSSESCADITAIASFSLRDGSTLTLDEAGTVCGPGNSFSATGPQSQGNPGDYSGGWEVQDGTGQFAGMAGEGTVTRRGNGGHFSGNYTGTLEA